MLILVRLGGCVEGYYGVHVDCDGTCRMLYVGGVVDVAMLVTLLSLA